MAAVMLAGLCLAAPASAGPIVVGNPNWYEFGFGAAGTFAINGIGTTPSSGGNSQFADDPAWTFTAGAGGVLFTLTDAFSKGDSFEAFDFGVSIGATPAVTSSPTGISDPAITSLDPTWSSRVYLLGAGAHSITIKTLTSPFGSGAAYFRTDDATPAAVPEPATLSLAALAVGCVVAARRFRRGRGNV